MKFSRMICRLGPVWPLYAVFAAGATIAVPAMAGVCSAMSGPKTVVLVELYTSEGCNSCPPADRWLASTFPSDSAGAIALAFHVDYWDRLAWKDRFASPAWTERQYASAHANRSRWVYTPQVFVQGRDYPDWRGRGSATTIAAADAKPARARIAVEADTQRGAVAVKATAHVPAGGDRKGAMLYVALVDSQLVSQVKAGENAGVRLTHDHVVRALRGGIAIDADGDGGGDIILPLPAEAGMATTIVAFVQNAETGDVLQALALPLTASACGAAR